MFQPGDHLFIQFDTEKAERELHRSTVVDCSDEVVTVLENHNLRPDVGDEVTVFFKHKRTFVKQWAKIKAVCDLPSEDPDSDRPEIQVKLDLVGDIISADARECYRALAIFEDWSITVGGRHDCQVVDVSPTGLAVITEDNFAVGQKIDIEGEFEEIELAGSVRIQNVRPVRGRRLRYGLLSSDASLSERLQRICIGIQRNSLQKQT